MEGFSQPFTFVVIAPVNHATSAAYLLALLPGLIAAVWLCGFVTVVTLWSVRWRRVAAAVHRSVPMYTGREVDALRQLEKIGGVRRPMTLLLSRGSAMEPGIFGIFRPVLLWPATISEHLQDSHLRAILAHEVSHARRRDNLAAALHMAVEGLFWFHPMVWWLGARLVEERELACDEEVLQLGNPPSIYAESILKTCEFCVGVAAGLRLRRYGRRAEETHCAHHDSGSWRRSLARAEGSCWLQWELRPLLDLSSSVYGTPLVSVRNRPRRATGKRGRSIPRRNSWTPRSKAPPRTSPSRESTT